ncbi:flagellar type III secretion system protein FlhB [Hydrogenophaga aquatica]
MAESQTGDKTEKATPQKLRKSREQGQVPRSKDVSMAVGIAACLALMVQLVPAYQQDFKYLFALGFSPLDGEAALEDVWSLAFSSTMVLLGKMVAPLLLVPLAVALGSLYPGGWIFTTKNMEPKLERLNPLGYFQRLFKPRHVAGTVATALKAVVMLAVLYQVTTLSVPAFARLQSLAFNDALLGAIGLALNGVWALCGVFLLFALIDLPVQHFVFLREQRMSKRDVKEEHKSSEGRPEVRQRIRQLQQQIARRNVRRTVPTADAVIVNPEHYAVALKYETRRADAPFVIAKGIDEMALFIREVARENGVEVIELPPLARAIYNTSQVNQQIPVALYRAVAQVLRYVMQLQAFRQGARTRQPLLPTDLDIPSNLT